MLSVSREPVLFIALKNWSANRSITLSRELPAMVMVLDCVCVGGEYIGCLTVVLVDITLFAMDLGRCNRNVSQNVNFQVPDYWATTAN